MHRFGVGSDGAGPYASLIADSAHNLYGTTYGGGDNANCTYGRNATGCGTIFEMIPPAGQGGRWAEKVLYSFQGGNDGAFPLGGVIFDSAGNLYGVTTVGGTGAGTVYRLTPQTGGTWSETILYRFQEGGTDGSYPRGALAFDAAGNLYGTCNDGGAGYGTVFELSPQSNGEWIETILHTFNPDKRNDGGYPVDGVILDKAGNVYGVTAGGGSDKVGTMFKLSPPKIQGNPWYEQILYTFGNNGSYPEGIVFSRGAFWGTTEIGGEFNQGAVFQITFSGNTANETILYSFAGGDDGAGPYAGVTIDSALNIYGTTVGGGGLGGCTNFLNGCGTVFKLTPPQVQGEPWTETILHSFSAGTDGSSPDAVLLMQGGWLLGTTTAGGTGPCVPGDIVGCGTVFAVKK